MTGWGPKPESAYLAVMSASTGCGHALARGYVREVAIRRPRLGGAPTRLAQQATDAIPSVIAG